MFLYDDSGQTGGFMNKSLWLTVMLVLSLSVIPLTAVGQDLKAASENEKTRLEKEEITKLMIQVRRLPVSEQESRMGRIWKDPSGSKTPRSDFLFCVGLAYLGNYKAQAYLGSAYESGRGIVTDSYESYVWYLVALQNASGDAEAEQKLRKDRDRIKMSLVSVYPAPSDEELDELVKERLHRITEYQSEIGKAG